MVWNPNFGLPESLVSAEANRLHWHGIETPGEVYDFVCRSDRRCMNSVH